MDDPSVDGIPPHLLPYESELGPSVTLEDLIEFVFNMQKRPTIPNHWKWLPQVFCASYAAMWFLCRLDNIRKLHL